MSLNVNWTIGPQPLTPIEECEIIDYDMRSVGITLWALERTKNKAAWIDRDTWITANRRIAEQQVRLLMPCGADLVREIRALRDGPDTPLEAQDPTVDPFTLDLFSLRSIAGRLSTDGQSAAFILAQIRTLLEEQGEGEGGQLDALLQILALLAV